MQVILSHSNTSFRKGYIKTTLIILCSKKKKKKPMKKVEVGPDN